jgi:hypothetical protein
MDALEVGDRVKIKEVPKEYTHLNGMLFAIGTIKRIYFSSSLNEYHAVLKMEGIFNSANILEPTIPTRCLEPVNKEAVSHPLHYGGDTTYEVIKVIEAWEKLFPHLNFNLLTAIKYIPRAGIKDPKKQIEDLEKSIWYLNREIDRLKLKEKSNGPKAS